MFVVRPRTVLFASIALVLGACATSDPAGGFEDPGATADAGSGTDSGGNTFAGDARVAEGGSCQQGTMRFCFPADSKYLDAGACKSGTQSCVSSGELVGSWGPCTGAVVPTAEICADHIDNDCNGKVDENCQCDYQLQLGARDTPLCCNAGDKLVGEPIDCDYGGQNHSVSRSGECGIAHAGDGDYGAPCVIINCHGEDCPRDAGADSGDH